MNNWFVDGHSKKFDHQAVLVQHVTGGDITM